MKRAKKDYDFLSEFFLFFILNLCQLLLLIAN